MSLCLLLASVSALGQAPASTNLRISQVYPRGGETGAIYQSDFVELGDYRRAEMVKAFISSTEYRNRFGP